MHSTRFKDASTPGPPLRSIANVYLTGLSGSGKSTVGPILATRLGWTYVDTDRLIEGAAGMTVAEIFSTFGEDAFRRRETAIIEQIATASRQRVVALGGGAIIAPRNRLFLRESGLVVYLKASPHRLAERLATRTEIRPLLHTADGDVARRLARLLDERRDFYEEADLTIETDGLTADQIAEKIAARIA